LLTPALRSLKTAVPHASITLMASPAGAQVGPMLPWVDDVWPVEAVWQDASAKMALEPARERRLIDEIRERDFDAAFIFTSWAQSPYPAAYACYLAGVPVRIGESKEFGGSVLSHAADALPDEVHQADRNLHLLEHACIETDGSQLELAIPEPDAARIDAILQSHGIGLTDRFMAVAPGASCAARRYDATRYADAMRMLHERTSLPFVLLGSARERELTSFVRRTSAVDAIDLAGETSLGELAALIARASLLIANDSGPMHIADAVSCPMVVLYAGTEYESQWAPRQAPATLLRRETACSPCYAFECPYDMECLDIPAEEVALAAIERLRATAPPEPEMASTP
jgi:ADP-heptose:LPS heptosyltransferase